MTHKISHLEPADRPHLVQLSTGELAALIWHHDLFGKTLERDLPRLIDQWCDHPAAKEAVLQGAAAQLAAHSDRKRELQQFLEAYVLTPEAALGGVASSSTPTSNSNPSDQL